MHIYTEEELLQKGYKIENVKIKNVSLSMEEHGCFIGIGKGNDDWNQSAPHGAGRIMSRSKARETVSLGDFQQSMKGIYTTSVSMSTLDESPMIYKSLDEILENIKDTIDVIKIIKPIYNFKASE